MILKVDKILKSRFIKVGILNSISVLIKMGVMFFINKILAIYVGPAGYLVIGQFQNTLQVLNSLGGGAINTGVVKYTAEYNLNPQRQHKLWSTALLAALTIGLVVILLSWIFSEEASIWLLHDSNYKNIFIWLGVGFLFTILNNLALSILNGNGNIGLFSAANIAGSLISLLLVTYLVAKDGLYGALLALCLYQSITFLSTILIIQKAKWFQFKYFLVYPEIQDIKNLFKFALTAIVSSICAPLSNILIRGMIFNNLGASEAGYWEAMNRLSVGYLMIFTSALSVYYLPRFSELGSQFEIRRELSNGYKMILPVVCIFAFGVYFFREKIILIMFTEAFLPMSSLFLSYMIGDIFKIGSWLLSFLILGKAMIKVFIFMEIIFTLLYIGLNFILIKFFGLDGAALAYMFNYLLYWAAMYFLVKNTILKIKK
jgi:PST family polysaccharide transporter